ncbi:twin-arginine translocation signal domain-containing protein [Aeromonas veronii]
MRDFMKGTLMVVVLVGLAVYLAANVSMGVK